MKKSIVPRNFGGDINNGKNVEILYIISYFVLYWWSDGLRGQGLDRQRGNFHLIP